MIKIIDKQAAYERDIGKKHTSLIYSNECQEPCPSDDLECARLILINLGFFKLDCFQESTHTQAMPSLVKLDANSPEFVKSLKTLDMMSTRTLNTFFVFYLRKRRIHPQEILNSVTSKHYVNSRFLDFLHSLGCPVNVSQHYGWTGNINTSWKLVKDHDIHCEKPIAYNDHGGSAYDGHKMTLYWADVSQEVCFIVPSGRLPDSSNFPKSTEEDFNSVEFEIRPVVKTTTESCEPHQDIKSLSSLSDDGTVNSNLSKNTSDTDSNLSTRQRTSKQLLHGNVYCDIKILIVWLESLEDQHNLPISESSFILIFFS